MDTKFKNKSGDDQIDNSDNGRNNDNKNNQNNHHKQIITHLAERSTCLQERAGYAAEPMQPVVVSLTQKARPPTAQLHAELF